MAATKDPTCSDLRWQRRSPFVKVRGLETAPPEAQLNAAIYMP